MRITILNLITFVFIFYGLEIASAQEVVSSSGAYSESSDNSISWTIGETVTETISSSDNIITQGFQQSDLTVSKIEELINSNFRIQIFPNPTNEFVILKTDKYKNMSFQLYSFDGKLIQTADIFKEETKIKFNNYSAGVYFLKIIQTNKNYNNYQIVKTK